MAESEAPASAITWHIGKNDDNSSSSSSLSSELVTEDLGDGWILAHSSVRLSSSLYSGQDLTCMVQHPSLRAPERRTTRIPEQSVFLHPFFTELFPRVTHAKNLTGSLFVPFPSPPLLSLPEASQLSVHVERKHDPPLWLAVCECNGGTNLAWVLPDSAKGQTTMQSEYEGHVLRARLTYSFSLALHEGQSLTCVHHYGRGAREERTVQIPRYRKWGRSRAESWNWSARAETERRCVDLPQTSPP